MTGAHRHGVLSGGATPWRVAVCSLVLSCALARAQDVEALQKRVNELEKLVVTQQDQFAAKLSELEKRLDEQAHDEKSSEITEKVEDLSKQVTNLGKFFRRPVAGASTPTADIFTALHGGLIFTGLFRSRFEARVDNIDMNDTSSGIDDSGVRFNGRFRLGFGAVLNADPDGTGEQITALTEFQSVGNYANNSFLTLPSAAGVPVPIQFNIFVEPFEVVNLYQGYVAFQRLIDKTINVKIGRQELVFGNEMILGNNSFQEGTVHDALLAQWQPCDDYRFSAFYAKEAGSDLGIGSSRADFNEDEMAGLYFEYERKNKLDRKFEAYALYFNARSTAQNTFVTGSTAYMFDGSYRPPILGHFWTLGARAFATDIKICKDILTVNAEAAWQTGDDTTRDNQQPNLSSTRSIEGLCTEILVNYRFNPAGEGVRPIATLGYFYSSGGDDIVDGDIGFQPLFINRHFELSDRNDIYKPYYPGGGRYGNMDQLPLFNVHIMKAALSIALTEKIELGAGYLYGVTAHDEGYGTGPFGQEIDLFASYAYNDYVQFSASASVFFPGRTATDLSDLLFFDTVTGVKHAADDPAFSFYVQALVQF